MAIIKVTLTEDMLKLISNIHFTRVPQMPTEKDNRQILTWGLDFASLYGGSYVFEDISYILGRYDEHIEGTEDDPMGVKFTREFTDYMWEMHEYILNNIGNIEELVHVYSNKGGLTPGTYKCKNNEHIWEKESEN